MRGPNDLRDILSGLKTKKINLSGKEEKKSTISVDDMKELNSSDMSRPKKAEENLKASATLFSFRFIKNIFQKLIIIL